MTTDPSSDPECIFCKILAGEIPSFKIHEDDKTLAFMDINPLHPGHSLVIPKGHFENIYTAPDEVLADMIAATRRLATAVNSALSPDGVNVIQANGPGAAQSVFHIHFHVVPRKTGDNAKINWGLNPGDMDEIAAVAEKIRGTWA